MKLTALAVVVLALGIVLGTMLVMSREAQAPDGNGNWLPSWPLGETLRPS